MQFKRGQRVKINKTGQYGGQSTSGDKEYEGEIVGTIDDNPEGYSLINGFQYVVFWDYQNRDKHAHFCYRDEHLFSVELEEDENGLIYLTSIQG